MLLRSLLNAEHSRRGAGTKRRFRHRQQGTSLAGRPVKPCGRSTTVSPGPRLSPCGVFRLQANLRPRPRRAPSSATQSAAELRHYRRFGAGRAHVALAAGRTTCAQPGKPLRPKQEFNTEAAEKDKATEHTESIFDTAPGMIESWENILNYSLRALWIYLSPRPLCLNAYFPAARTAVARMGTPRCDAMAWTPKAITLRPHNTPLDFPSAFRYLPALPAGGTPDDRVPMRVSRSNTPVRPTPHPAGRGYCSLHSAASPEPVRDCT